MQETLTSKALNRALLARQMLLSREKIPLTGAVARLVGLQAQQTRPPFIALWSRVDGFERGDLLRALRSWKIVRATTLRGTLHLMTAQDFINLRATLQPMLTAGMRSALGERADTLDVAALVAAARRVFDERARTFTELRAELMRLFPAGEERAMGFAARMHLPLLVEPDETEWGYRNDADFAVAETRLGEPLAGEAKPQELVRRYLAVFGPATTADVQAWCGLRGLQPVLEEMRPQLATFRDERKRELFDLPDAPRPSLDIPAPVRFLADFDNAILSHADRARIIAEEHRSRITTKNLLVPPTFLVDGFVAGTWKSARVKKNAVLTLTPFAKVKAGIKAELAEEGKKLLRFLEPGAEKIEVKFA